MTRVTLRWLESVVTRLLIATVLVVAMTAFPLAADAQKPPFPFAKVQHRIDTHFASLTDFRPQDLITRGMVEPILRDLQRDGWNLTILEKGVDFYLADNHPLAVLFRTPKGKTLMRKIGAVPQAYDRLERLASFPAGRQLVERIMNDTDGQKLVEQLCRPESMHALSMQWGHEPSMVNFDVPCGRLYTKAAFVDHLKTMHALGDLGLERPGD